MIRERILKVVLVIVGMLFLATVYPLVAMHLEESLQMMLSIYVTLGVFLLLASRDPSEHRSLIAFTAWSSFAHAGVMAVQSLHDLPERVHLLSGAVAFAVVGIVLVALASAKERAPDTSSPPVSRHMTEMNRA
jgi:hypothetical protein